MRVSARVGKGSRGGQRNRVREAFAQQGLPHQPTVVEAHGGRVVGFDRAVDSVECWWIRPQREGGAG